MTDKQSASLTWSHDTNGSTATFLQYQCRCRSRRILEIPVNGIVTVECECGRVLSIRYGNPEAEPVPSAHPCPRCSHGEHGHSMVGVLVWCWECQLPCGKLRPGVPADLSWDGLRGIIQNDLDAGIAATVRKLT